MSADREPDLTGHLSRGFALAALLGLIAVWSAVERFPVPGAEVTLDLGFLLLASFIGGQLAGRLGLSRVTGYILVGLVLGPSLLGYLGDADADALSPFSGLAIALIALTAGGELNLRELRSSGRSLLAIAGSQVATIGLLVFGAVIALRDVLPFTAGRSGGLVIAIALIFASVAVASSPAVAIAVITDTRSKGPVSTTVLGVTVVKDVAVIILFAIALAVTYGLLEPGDPGQVAVVRDVSRAIGGSLLVGAVAGALMAGYLRWIGRNLVLFTVAAAWLLFEVAAVLRVELLLVGLGAGFVLENLVPTEGSRFVSAVEAASMPLYAIFFGLAGARVHLAELADVWMWALLLILVRAVGIGLGTRLGCWLAGSPTVVRQTSWPAFISQAGVALGMVELVALEFPTWGGEIRGLFVAMVAVHELIGPVLAKRALDRAGETGRARERRVPPGAKEVPAT